MNFKAQKLFFSLALLLLMVVFSRLEIAAAQAADSNLDSDLNFKSDLSLDSDSSLNSDSDLDSDGDGYSDAQEIKSGYSPVNPAKLEIAKSDMDKDNLSDYWELKFQTDPLNADSDGDGYKDGVEIDFSFNPLSSSSVKLARKIEINLKNQKLVYFVGGQPWKEFSVSTGKASMPTPKGNYQIFNKAKKAWSNTYKLWMPYWLGLDHGQFGIHELPLWPSGYREGADHLGKPVSHGCIRLGIGPAQYLYERVDKGTEVTIK